MRSRTVAPVLLAVLLPACLSGFSEVRIAGGDASAPGDRPAADRPLADAPGAPDGAQDAPALDVVALDAPADVIGPLDAPEDRAAPDAGDVVDVPAPEDARDAGAGLDAVDAPELRDVVAAEDRVEVSAGDVVDVPAPVDAGPCAGDSACGVGLACVDGRCGQWSFRGIVEADARDVTRSGDAALILQRLDAACASRLAGARSCPSTQIVPREAAAASCAARDRSVISGPVSPRPGQDAVAGCLVCGVDGGVFEAGSACSVGVNPLACCAFAPR